MSSPAATKAARHSWRRSMAGSPPRPPSPRSLPRPGVAMVSRGPGATNAAIGIHAAQQDAAPMILVIGQVPKKDLRKEAFQEIDYQQMFGALAKWVCQVTAPEDLAAAAFKAVRGALSGLPGPVVLVIPEDIQQQQVAVPQWVAVRSSPTQPDPATVRQICRLLQTARRPLIIAGSALDRAGGREALLDLATQLQIPVAVSFRGHDLFPNQHALFAGDLGLANPAAQIAAFAGSDLILALGTRLGDITTQGYRFPVCPRPTQTLVHCIPDAHYLTQLFVADIGVVADPVATLRAILAAASGAMDCRARAEWAAQLNALQRQIAAWATPADGRPGGGGGRHGGPGAGRVGGAVERAAAPDRRLRDAGGRRRHTVRRCGALPASTCARGSDPVPGRGQFRRAGVPAFSVHVPAAADGLVLRRHGLWHAGRSGRAIAPSGAKSGVPGRRRRFSDDRQRDGRRHRTPTADLVHRRQQPLLPLPPATTPPPPTPPPAPPGAAAARSARAAMPAPA